MPASTSSNTRVAGLGASDPAQPAPSPTAPPAPPPPPPATPINASIAGDSSPPDALSRNGPAGTPGFGAMRNSTSSPPAGPQPSLRGATRASNVAPSMARAA